MLAESGCQIREEDDPVPYPIVKKYLAGNFSLTESLNVSGKYGKVNANDLPRYERMSCFNNVPLLQHGCLEKSDTQ